MMGTTAQAVHVGENRAVVPLIPRWRVLSLSRAQRGITGTTAPPLPMGDGGVVVPLIPRWRAG
jgi:hypothetical protein